MKEVPPYEAMSLRAVSPPHVTISPWKACNPRLPALIRGEPLEHVWSELTPTLQEVACAEFLRLHGNPRYPKLAFLLLPVGRTLKDIDIYGVDLQEREIFAQVTYRSKGDRSSLRKVEALKKYGRPDNHLVYICRCPESEYEDGVLYVPVEEVLDWIEENPVFRDKIFSV